MKKAIVKNLRIINFCSAHKFTWKEGFLNKGESHASWELVLVRDGIAQATENFQVYTLNKRDLIFHAPMEFHSISTPDNIPTEVFITSFEIEGEVPTNLSEGVFSLSVEEFEELGSIFERIFSFYYDLDDNEFLGSECAHSFASYILRLSKNNKTKIPILNSRSAKEYNKVVVLMNEKLYENLSLNDFATLSGISISQLKVLFNKFLGISPKLYYSKQRCNEAIRLLRNGVSASEISSMMNFSSPSYFSVFLKKLSGHSPNYFIPSAKK